MPKWLWWNLFSKKGKWSIKRPRDRYVQKFTPEFSPSFRVYLLQTQETWLSMQSSVVGFQMTTISEKHSQTPSQTSKQGPRFNAYSWRRDFGMLHPCKVNKLFTCSRRRGVCQVTTRKVQELHNHAPLPRFQPTRPHIQPLLTENYKWSRLWHSRVSKKASCQK